MVLAASQVSSPVQPIHSHQARISHIVSLSGTPIPFNKYRNITNSTHQSTRIIR